MIKALNELLAKGTKGLNAELRLNPDDEYIPIVIFSADAAGVAFVYAGSDDFILHKPWRTIETIRVPASAYTTSRK